VACDDRALAIILLVLTFFILWFFRNPERQTPDDLHDHADRFISANLDKPSDENERNADLIPMADGRMVLAIQIAGFIARGINCWITPGMRVQKGERFGLIRFGSRVEVFLPSDTHLAVSAGDKVNAGERPLGTPP
jgi:phosphatidylserine decarboxylase